jgi:pimeloyl-ACP methyl ester carboxylesterase
MPYADSDDARIWWQAQGTGDVLLLIMGLGLSSELWFRVLPGLAERHRVITFDNRGAGRTIAPGGRLTVPLMARDAAAVLRDATGGTGGTVHVLGISLGGMIAQELVLAGQVAVGSLILASTHAGPATAIAPAAEVSELYRRRAEFTAEQAMRATRHISYSLTTSDAVVEEDFRRRLEHSMSADRYLAQLSAAGRWEGSLSRLAGLTPPTLVIHGTLDKLVPPANATQLATAIPNARLHWIDGAGHLLFTDAPADLIDTVTSFIDDVTNNRC